MGEVVVDLVDMHQHMGQILIHDDCKKPFQLHGTRQKVINSDLKLAIARGASLSFHFHVGLGQVPSPPDPPAHCGSGHPPGTADDHGPHGGDGPLSIGRPPRPRGRVRAQKRTPPAASPGQRRGTAWRQQQAGWG